MVSVTYPKDTPGSGAGTKYTYTFDNLGRPNKLTDDQATPADWAKNVVYYKVLGSHLIIRYSLGNR